MKKDVIKALSEEEEGFENIKVCWRKWRKRNDLFDHVVTRRPEFIVGFIKQVKKAKSPHLLHFFSRDLDSG